MQHYLFVHFREKTSPDGEQVHFAVSRDGFHWQALNGGHPVLWAYYGDRGVRDMTIVRDHTSGKFHIFATDLSLSYGMRNQYQHSWRNIGLNGSRDLAHWVSDDLVHWSEEEMVRFGTDMTDLSITDRAKLGVSYAFQQPVRFKGITVLDLLRIASGKRLSVSEACAILSEVGLCARDYVNREVNGSLSGGELKRIEIATVLTRGTQLSVFDEPEAGIDLWSFQNLISVFERMRQVRSDRTILVISHQERILNIADEIIVLAEGKIVSHGSRAEILPTLLGTPSAVSACAQLEKTTGKEGNC